ncbi:6-phospho-beta-glucosidase [Weizmannia acidilactici]|uniref:6-phospho-beta-glucosidase n=1 Tax=Weizmannia acidilactici TaxID=2607726 RepID=A0A5J4JIN3_9BACI|nr:glycoside hydrolase family 1 protein [Weizmannia acidilactici]GER70328.1 6-phospho-beta-glucosidase [Weizmannia acidilactici]GER73572.1 6-phospho-beta-glucosidase [Weizmannia acidilactici]
MPNQLREGFLWGNSVSSMQTEGAWNEGGKGLSVYDIRKPSEFASDWKVAIDAYHRYEEDFDLMQQLGMNCYRFQISWSRVNPTGDGEFNEEGIAFYDKFIDALIERGIEPMICLYHFDMPLHLAETYNGFISRKVVDAFVRYGKEMVDRFGKKVKYWITFNEQNLYHMPGAFRISGYMKGEKTLDELYKIQHHVMMAHASIANYIHENYKDIKIGGMLAYSEIYPATCKPNDVFVARKLDEFFNYNLLEAFTNGCYSHEVMSYVKNEGIDMGILEGDLDILSSLKSDFLAFSYYASTTVNSELIPEGTPVNYYMEYGKQENPYLDSTEWKWQIDPLGFRDILNKIYNRFKLPVFPIENGIGVKETWDGEHEIQDDYRIRYHRDHIQAMKDAIFIDGVDVVGYLGWGLIDILSSQGDMRKRYGVVYVNRENHDLKDLRRVPKKSFWWLQKVIKSNGADLGD